jgi:hypothetical protein
VNIDLCHLIQEEKNWTNKMAKDNQ